jgi:hypothetical protein
MADQKFLELLENLHPILLRDVEKRLRDILCENEKQNNLLDLVKNYTNNVDKLLDIDDYLDKQSKENIVKFQDLLQNIISQNDKKFQPSISDIQEAIESGNGFIFNE